MLVVLAIIGVVTAVALVGEQGFQRVSLVSNTAYDVAITFRNAQVFGISSAKGQAQFLAGYGVDLNKNNTTSFILFDDTKPDATTANDSANLLCTHLPQINNAADATAPNSKPGNCVYDSGQDPPLQTYRLGNGITIKNVCAVKGSSSYCWTGGTVAATQIDVVFQRPNTTGSITASTNGTWPPLAQQMDYACLQLQGPSANPISRYIFVSSLGQVSAATTTCP